MIMKRQLNGSWQELYPKTLAENVSLNDGRTIQDYKEEVDRRFPEQIPLWEGVSLMDEDDEVTPSKPLSGCATGWILRWQAYSDGSTTNAQFHYTHLPKIHIAGVEGYGFRSVLGHAGGTMVHKYTYAYNDRVVGHNSNVNGDNGSLALSAIFEY